MSGVLAQVGFSKETTWGTPVTPVTRFHELVSETITETYARIESASLRDGQRVQRADRFAPNFKGAAGTIELEVMSKGFGFFLEHMVGGSVTSTAGAAGNTSAFTHNAKIGSLAGKGITCQVGRPYANGAGVQAYTYAGGKFTGWELANAVDGFLMFRGDLDFASVAVATALATEVYPTSMEILSYIGGLITVGGAQIDVSDISIRATQNVKADRYFIRQNTQKKEQAEAGMREYVITGTMEYENQTMYNRVASLTAAGAMGDLIAKWEGSLVAGASTAKNTLQATVNTARFDVFQPTVGGPDLLSGGFEARILDDGDALTALSLDYISADTTP